MTLKRPLLTPVPPAAWRLTLPVWAFLGTVNPRRVDEIRENLAVTPPSLTQLTRTKFEPVIVTRVPTLPLAGEKRLIFGASTTFVGAPVVVVCVVVDVPLPAW